MSFSVEDSLLDASQNNYTEGMDSLISTVILALKNCSREYQEKTKENAAVLNKLGFEMGDFPQDLRNELREILSDSEVFNFRPDDREVLTVNMQYVMDSLRTDSEIAQSRRTKVLLDEILRRLQNTNNNLHRRLEIEKIQAEHLNEQANDKAVKGMVFRNKLQEVQRELSTLEQISELTEKPKYSSEDIQGLRDEWERLQAEVALTQTKLVKYNGLSLLESEASRQLAELTDSLNSIEGKIKKKVREN